MVDLAASLTSTISSRLSRWRMDGYVRRGRCLLTRLHAAAVTRIPVCLLYPWPWWQANKTPGPAYTTATILRTSIRPVITTITTGPLIRPLEWINDFILPDGSTLCPLRGQQSPRVRQTRLSLRFVGFSCHVISVNFAVRYSRAKRKVAGFIEPRWFILNNVSSWDLCMYVERVLLRASTG